MRARFGTDGIRGLANADLSVELVTAVGRAAVRALGVSRPYLVGRDTRRSGPMLEAALVAGMCAEGAEVRLGGVLPTPGVAHLAQRHDACGAVISASHNPFTDNGVKLLARGGRKLTDAEQQRVEQELDALLQPGGGGGAVPSGTGVGIAAELRGALDEYVARLVGVFEGQPLAGLRVVLDCGNGAAFRAAPRVFRELGAEVDARNASPTGENINDHCGSTDPSGLQRAVVETGAYAGLAFDGDADRVVAVDEHGALLDGDDIIAVMALELKARGLLRHDAVALTVMSNIGLRRYLADRGVAAVETPVGDRYVVEAMAANDLVLGGEQSGHVIFADVAATGDGILTGARFLEAVTRSQRPVSAVSGLFESWPQALHNVRVADQSKLDSDAKFWKLAARASEELGEEGRVLVRPSGTEPVVRVLVEAHRADVAEAIAVRLAAAVEKTCGRARPSAQD